MKRKLILTKALATLLIMFSVVFAQKKQIIAYFPEWGAGPFPFHLKNLVDSKAAEKLTVINYAFAEPKPDGKGGIYPALMSSERDYQQVYTADISVDGKADDPNQPLKGHFNQVRKLKKMYPHLRVVISIGGWAGSAYFSNAALTEESRNYFVDRCLEMFIFGNLPVIGNSGGDGVAKGVFDGIDLDWEYPVSGGLEGNNHNPADKENMTKLLKLFREKLDKIDKKLLLTVAYPAPEKILTNYDVAEDQKYLNWFTLMTYDFKGSWDPVSGHHTNILSDANSENSMDNTVKLFLNKYKVPGHKIIPGAAFYGRVWKVESAENTGLYQKGKDPQEYYKPGGFNYFDQLIPKKNNPYKKFWDVTAVTPYVFNKETMEFWTLDDEQSIALKAQYADAYNLGGIMFWEITGDTTSILVDAILNKKMRKPEFVKPEIKIELTKEDAQYVKGDNILLNSKIDECINPLYVDFVLNNKVIGSDTQAPYNWVIFNAKKGKSKVKIIAYDKFGNKFESQIKEITVK